MKKALALCLIGAVPLLGYSQQFTGYTYDNYAGVPAAVQNPALLSGNKYKVNVNLFSVSALAGNNAYELDRNRLLNFDFDGLDENKDYFKSANTNKKHLWINTDILGPSVLITTGRKSGVALFTRARTIVNESNLSDRTFRFINSDEGFYDTDIKESNVQFKGHAFGEAGLSYGRTVYSNNQHTLKIGITGKYVVGLAAAGLWSKNAHVNVASNDQFNQLSGDLNVRYSKNLDDVDNFEIDDIVDRESGNHGIGFDLGVVYEWKPAGSGETSNWFSKDQTPYKLRLSASITDIGTVKYKNSEQGKTYMLNGAGHDAEELEQGDDETFEEYFDRLETTGLLNMQNAHGDLKVKLPTALRVDADWHVYKRLFINAGTVINLVKSEFSAHYTSSFTVTPRLEKKWFSIYSPVYYNLQHQKIAWGAGIRLGPVFAGSASVLSNLVSSKNIAATDFHAGLSIPIFQRTKKAKAELPPPPPPVVMVDTVEKTVEVVKQVNTDKDFDGVVDEKDECPDVFGEVALLGCPDADKDSVADIHDKCPDVPGLKRYNGCPAPDSDGDGLNDEEDKCPNEAGLKKYNGCPIPDTDGDGVNDEEDKCPQVAGLRSLQGCPEVKQEVVKKVNTAAKSIYFLTGKEVIQKVSYARLDTVASILQSDSDLKISIEGHTDNVGSVTVNETLSYKRAEAVKAYLVSKGVDENRIRATGFGSSKPVASNLTADGRAKNRRVELHLSY